MASAHGSARAVILVSRRLRDQNNGPEISLADAAAWRMFHTAAAVQKPSLSCVVQDGLVVADADVSTCHDYSAALDTVRVLRGGQMDHTGRPGAVHLVCCSLDDLFAASLRQHPANGAEIHHDSLLGEYRAEPAMNGSLKRRWHAFSCS